MPVTNKPAISPLGNTVFSHLARAAVLWTIGCMLTACQALTQTLEQTHGFALSVWQKTENTREISINNPPLVGDIVQAQADMVVCRSRNAAISMALSGLFADGCTRLDNDKVYKVVALDSQHFGNDNAVLIVSVVIDSQRTELFVPLPWHNWS